jgi:hypothetical protein
MELSSLHTQKGLRRTGGGRGGDCNGRGHQLGRSGVTRPNRVRSVQLSPYLSSVSKSISSSQGIGAGGGVRRRRGVRGARGVRTVPLASIPLLGPTASPPPLVVPLLALPPRAPLAVAEIKRPLAAPSETAIERGVASTDMKIRTKS